MHPHEHAPKPDRSARTSTPAPAKATAPTPGLSAQSLLALQRSAGNAAVVQMLRQAGHPWAQEQHQHGANCGHQQPAVQRSAVHDVLRTAGQPLDDSMRGEMETRLGSDFSDVRLHTDSMAKVSADEVGARAYTSGNHIVVGNGGVDKHTLAHELTHVIQQRRGPVAGSDTGNGLRVSDPSDRFEKAAEENATRAMSSAPPQWIGHGDTERAKSAGRNETSVQRVPNETTIADDDHSIAFKAVAHARTTGVGRTRYTIDTPEGAGTMFRAMSRGEYLSLARGTYGQGNSLQGFSPERAYSETYVTNNLSCPYLIQFYSLSEQIHSIREFMLSYNAPEKVEDGIMSVALGATAPWGSAERSATLSNDALTEKIHKERLNIETANRKIESATRAKNDRELLFGNKHLANAQNAIAKYEARYNPADTRQAAKEFARAIQEGRIGWRILTLVE